MSLKEQLNSTRRVSAPFLQSVNEDQQEVKWYQDVSLIVIMVVCLIIVPFSQFIIPTTAYAKATSHTTAANLGCGSPQTGHCYGIQDWSGPISGSRTDIKVVQLACNTACQSSGFLDNEMWLSDTQTSSCVSNKWRNCWVEAGYLDDGVCGFCYFWADVRPVDGSNLNLHYIEDAFGLDGPYYDLGKSMRFSIYKQGTNQFQVSFVPQSCSGGCTNIPTAYSTNNTMAPNDIRMGTELAGTGPNSDWHAPRADYTNNYYWKGFWSVQGGYGYGPGNNYVGNAPPPYQSWVNGVVGGPTGGDFYTYCC